MEAFKPWIVDAVLTKDRYSSLHTVQIVKIKSKSKNELWTEISDSCVFAPACFTSDAIYGFSSQGYSLCADVELVLGSLVLISEYSVIYDDDKCNSDVKIWFKVSKIEDMIKLPDIYLQNRVISCMEHPRVKTGLSKFLNSSLFNGSSGNTESSSGDGLSLLIKQMHQGSAEGPQSAVVLNAGFDLHSIPKLRNEINLRALIIPPDNEDVTEWQPSPVIPTENSQPSDRDTYKSGQGAVLTEKPTLSGYLPKPPLTNTNHEYGNKLPKFHDVPVQTGNSLLVNYEAATVDACIQVSRGASQNIQYSKATDNFIMISQGFSTSGLSISPDASEEVVEESSSFEVVHSTQAHSKHPDVPLKLSLSPICTQSSIFSQEYGSNDRSDENKSIDASQPTAAAQQTDKLIDPTAAAQQTDKRIDTSQPTAAAQKTDKCIDTSQPTAAAQQTDKLIDPTAAAQQTDKRIDTSQPTAAAQQTDKRIDTSQPIASAQQTDKCIDTSHQIAASQQTDKHIDASQPIAAAQQTDKHIDASQTTNVAKMNIHEVIKRPIFSANLNREINSHESVNSLSNFAVTSIPLAKAHLPLKRKLLSSKSINSLFTVEYDRSLKTKRSKRDKDNYENGRIAVNKENKNSPNVNRFSDRVWDFIEQPHTLNKSVIKVNNHIPNTQNVGLGKATQSNALPTSFSNFTLLKPLIVTSCNVTHSRSLLTSHSGVSHSQPLFTSNCDISHSPALHTSHSGLSHSQHLLMSHCDISHSHHLSTSHCGISHYPALHTSHCDISHYPALHTSHCDISHSPALHTSHSDISHSPALHTSHCDISHSPALPISHSNVTNGSHRETTQNIRQDDNSLHRKNEYSNSTNISPSDGHGREPACRTYNGNLSALSTYSSQAKVSKTSTSSKGKYSSTKPVVIPLSSKFRARMPSRTTEITNFLDKMRNSYRVCEKCIALNGGTRVCATPTEADKQDVSSTINSADNDDRQPVDSPVTDVIHHKSNPKPLVDYEISIYSGDFSDDNKHENGAAVNEPLTLSQNCQGESKEQVQTLKSILEDVKVIDQSLSSLTFPKEILCDVVDCLLSV